MKSAGENNIFKSQIHLIVINEVIRILEYNMVSRVPCSADEIARIENRVGLALPSVYKWFLQGMGHDAGVFMLGS